MSQCSKISPPVKPRQSTTTADGVLLGSQVSGDAVAVSRMQRRLRRKNRTAAARHPYLGERARCRAEEKGRHSESKREAGADRSGTGFFVSLWKSQAAIGATAGFAVLRRLMKTYPPMPTRSSSDAATWPGSGTAAGPGPPAPARMATLGVLS